MLARTRVGLGTAAAIAALLIAGSVQQAVAFTPATTATVVYTFGNPPARGFYNFDSHLTVLSDAGGTDHFWAQQFTFDPGGVGYVGLQSNGVMRGARVGKMAIFSIFGAVDASGPSCERFDEGGGGYSCRIRYGWVVGREYRLRVHELCCSDAPTVNEQWGAWVLDTVTGDETFVGEITVPGSWGWLDERLVTFSQYFGDVPSCGRVPFARVRFRDVSADSGTHVPTGSEAATHGTCGPVTATWCEPHGCFQEGGQRMTTSPGGPVVLMGIDAEDADDAYHGPTSNYARVVADLLANVWRTESGILVVGGGKDPQDDVTQFWTQIGQIVGRPVTFVAGERIETVDLGDYALVAIASSSEETPSGGLTDAENTLLASRREDIRDFVTSGGGLLGLSQAYLDRPWAYLASLGRFDYHSGLEFEDITPTARGGAIGITDELDVRAWHDDFAEWPDFLQILATNDDGFAHAGHAAALGGASIRLPEYVALGDSIAAGEGAASRFELYEDGCLRDSDAYPRVFAGKISVRVRHTACSGAKIANLKQHQTARGERVPPQIDSVSADTDLVTLTIGANNLKWSSVIADCYQHACTKRWPELSDDIRELKEPLEEALRLIDDRTGDGEVLLVGYPHFFPPRTQEQDNAIWINRRCKVFRGEIRWLRSKFEEARDVMRDAVAAVKGEGRTNIAFLDTLDAFADHERCTGDAWVNGLTKRAGDQGDSTFKPSAGSFHPTSAGYAAMADRVLDWWKKRARM